MTMADLETSSEDYAQRFSGATGAWLLARQTYLLKEFMRDLAPCRVLDVGGGHAQAVKPLLELGCQVTVLGSHPDCSARLTFWHNHPAFSFEVGDFLAMPIKNYAFDVVLSLRLVPHCEAWSGLLSEMRRVARRAVIIDYPCLESLNGFSPYFFDRKRRLEGNTRNWISFRHHDIAANFRDAGWSRLTLRKQFFWPMVLHRKLNSPRLSAGLEKTTSCLGLRRIMGSPVMLKAMRDQSVDVDRTD